MISRKNLLDMIATEALEKGPTEHYFDERYRAEPGEAYPRAHDSYTPLNFQLRIIRNPDGTLDWAE